MRKKVLEMTGITKYIFDSFGKPIRNTNVKILDNVNFDLFEGEVHVLVGENGAGKSTLMNIIGGIIPADEGIVKVCDEKVNFCNPRDAKQHGIGFIHQELNLCSNIDIAHNIFLGKEPTKFSMVNKDKMYQDTKILLESINFKVDPKTLVRNLSTAQKQLVEIVKALSYNSKILIMDEPTASLTNKEINVLFNLIKKLKKKNTSIIYISHRFDELTEIE